MKKALLSILILAAMASGNLFAQHHSVKSTTIPNLGTVLEYGVSEPMADRATTDDPNILWQKYENGAMPDDVFYIEATGDYLVYYGLNDKRLTLFEYDGSVIWEKPINSGGRAAISLYGYTIAYSDNNDLYVVNLDGEEIFHETFAYPVTHFKLTSEGDKIYVSYGRYEDNYYAIACYNIGTTKSEPLWVIGDLTVNVVGLSLSKDNARLVAAFAQDYKQIWVIDPMTGDILQNDLYYYDNSPSQDILLTAISAEWPTSTIGTESVMRAFGLQAWQDRVPPPLGAVPTPSPTMVASLPSAHSISSTRVTDTMAVATCLTTTPTSLFGVIQAAATK